MSADCKFKATLFVQTGVHTGAHILSWITGIFREANKIQRNFIWNCVL